jgi:DNA-binding transcriptional ArsR family regulator
MAAAPQVPGKRGRRIEPAQVRTIEPEPLGALATDAGAPDPERLVSDVETLKALSDPLRLRILETMVSRSDSSWSVKELAAALDVPQTRLYHHVELLLERDLIRLASQRVVSGIIESRYRVAALSFRLDRRFLAADPELHDGGRELLHSVFDSARDEVAAALHAWLSAHPEEDPGGEGADDEPDRPLLTRGLAMLTPERATEFRRRLVELMGEYDTDASSTEAVPFGFLFALYPTPSAPEPSDD